MLVFIRAKFDFNSASKFCYAIWMCAQLFIDIPWIFSIPVEGPGVRPPVARHGRTWTFVPHQHERVNSRHIFERTRPVITTTEIDFCVPVVMTIGNTTRISISVVYVFVIPKYASLVETSRTGSSLAKDTVASFGPRFLNECIVCLAAKLPTKVPPKAC